MRLLAREREDRFPSTQALLEALAPAVAAPLPALSEPVYGRPATVFEPPPMAGPEPIPSGSRRSGSDWGAPSHTPVPEPIPSGSRRSGSDWGAPYSTPVPETAPAPPRSAILKWGAVAAALAVVGLGIWLAAHFFFPTPATAIPVLAPPGGTYAEAQSITISDAAPNAVIHYTVDGTPPTEASPIYAFPIASLASGAVLRAMAASDGHKPSPDVTGVYIWSAAARSEANSAATAPAPANVLYDQAKSAYDHRQYVQARTLFSQACGGGNMNACSYLGALYDQGLGGSQDEDKAKELFQKACDQGYFSSCTNLGIVYQGASDINNARKYFKKACDGGLSKACELLRGVQ